MKLTPALSRSHLAVGWAVLFFGAGVAYGQIPLDAATLQSLRAKPVAEVETFTKTWVDAQVATQGREAAADSLSKMVVENPSLARQALLIRGFGSRLEPEFSGSVLEQIATTDKPLVRGGLLQLLRDTAPENAPQIARWLTDERLGEDLVEQSKTAPKLRESIATGVLPFRVCDMAFNVIEEITAADEMKVQLLNRSQNYDSRNERIDGFLGVNAPARSRPIKHSSSQPAPISQFSNEDDKSTAASTRPEASPQKPAAGIHWVTVVAVLVAVLVAAVALLVWWQRGRK